MAGVYISYPFCAQKCTYCNFASGVFPRKLESRYIETLHEAKCGQPNGLCCPKRFTSAAARLVRCRKKFYQAYSRSFPANCGLKLPWKPLLVRSHDRKPTRGAKLESIASASACSPSSRRNLRARAANIRLETVAQDVRHTARAAGSLEYPNLDLIAGLPFQTGASWLESLDRIETIGAPHVSVYMLEVDDDSNLGRELQVLGQRYGAPFVPSEDAIAEFYEIAVERLRGLGIERYEISNFARPGFESRHNLKYWRREPYLGFGADAHSFNGELRWSHEESAAKYCDDSGEIEKSPADPIGERFFLGLRLSEGIEGPWEPFAEPINRFLEDGLLEKIGDRIRLTPRGVMLSNEVFQEFVGCSESREAVLSES